MTTLTIQSLRDIPATLTTAIDSYIVAVETKDGKSSPEKATAWKKVTDAANGIIRPSRNPFNELLKLGLQVS